MLSGSARTLVVAMVAGAAVSATAAADALKLKFVAAAYVDTKNAGLTSPQSVACGTDGVTVADGDGRLVHFTAGEKTLVGSKEFVPKAASYPLRIEPLPGGDLVVLDATSRKLQRVGPDGTLKGTIPVSAAPGSSLAVIRSIATDASGKIYVLDAPSGTVVVLDGSGTESRRIAFSSEGGLVDVAVGEDGSVYVLDARHGRVLVARTGQAEGSALEGDLRQHADFPTAMVAWSGGRLLVADQHSGTLLLLRSDGSVAGEQAEFGWAEGQLRYPSDLCIDAKGRLFVADRDNRRVQMFQLSE